MECVIEGTGPSPREIYIGEKFELLEIRWFLDRLELGWSIISKLSFLEI